MNSRKDCILLLLEIIMHGMILLVYIGKMVKWQRVLSMKVITMEKYFFYLTQKNEEKIKIFLGT